MGRPFRKRIAPTGVQWMWALGFSAMAVFLGNDVRVGVAALRFVLSMVVWAVFAIIGNTLFNDATDGSENH